MAQGPGSARWCGKDVCRVGAARTGAAHLVLPRTFQHHHADPGQSGGLPGEKGSVTLSRRVTGNAPGRDRRRRSVTTMTGPFPRREVHSALEMCILHSKTTAGTALSNAKCTSRRRGAPRRPSPRSTTTTADTPAGPPGRSRRPPRSPSDPQRPSRGPWRRRLSKSATKARIAPEHRRRIVDIPHFFSRPIPARGAFVADLDTPPPRTAPGAPPAPPRARPSPPARRSRPGDCRSRRERLSLPG